MKSTMELTNDEQLDYKTITFSQPESPTISYTYLCLPVPVSGLTYLSATIGK